MLRGQSASILILVPLWLRQSIPSQRTVTCGLRSDWCAQMMYRPCHQETLASLRSKHPPPSLLDSSLASVQCTPLLVDVVHSISCWNCKNRASVDNSMKFSAEIPKVVQITMGYGGKVSVLSVLWKILAIVLTTQKKIETNFQPDSCQNNKVYHVQICFCSVQLKFW